MVKVLKFDKPGIRYDLPEVTVPLNTGWTLKEAGYRAVVDFGEVRINGSMLTDATQKKSLQAVVFAAAAYNDACEAYAELVGIETKNGRLQIFAGDLDRKSDIIGRRELELAVNRTEQILHIASEFFLALYQGREPAEIAFSIFGSFIETFLGDELKRDAYVS